MPVLTWSLKTSPQEGFSKKRSIWPSDEVTTTPYSSGLPTLESRIVALDLWS